MIANNTEQRKESTRPKAKRTSVSWEPELLCDAKNIARMVGFKRSFSAYVNDVVRKDIEWRTMGRNEKLRELVSA